jgi:redox-sensitive bicupin YhaK (pirin superfamily)
MSNIDLILPEKAADIGNFLVGRLLPFRQKRSVGPFVFIDHMGPARLSDHENLDVPPHPHIGLSTLTYLFEGAITHKDSMGNDLEIHPGDVNWMTAGSGVTHSERTPERLRHTDKSLHGLQIWIALPEELEETKPDFAHIEGKSLPGWHSEGADFKLIAGTLDGHRSPVPVYSPLYMLEIKAGVDTNIDLKDILYGESGLYVVEGSIENQGNSFGSKQLLITKEAHLCNFNIKRGSHVFLFGGNPFEEERFIYWNFVSSSKERIEQAKAQWAAHKFPKVPGDDGYVPLPGR